MEDALVMKQIPDTPRLWRKLEKFDKALAASVEKVNCSTENSAAIASRSLMSKVI